MSEYTMTRAEREAFLAEPHVAVLSVAAEEGRAPLTVPVWYAYERGGDIRFVTAPGMRKVPLLKRAGRASLCMQTETAPYKYVTVEGPVSFETPDQERDVRQVAHRYLGPEMGEMYLAATAEERREGGEVLVRMRPTRWSTCDFGKRKW
jgi:PPOX class probable F420-dependent enzyme